MEHIYEVTKQLLNCVKELEDAFPERRFTLDGHLLGSIGEIIAKNYYGIELYNQSKETHDGHVGERKIQIKITQRDRIDIVEKPEYLLVLFFDSKKIKFYEVYNGTGERAWQCTGKKNISGFYSMSIRKLNKLNNQKEYKNEQIKKGDTLKDFSDYLEMN